VNQPISGCPCGRRFINLDIENGIARARDRKTDPKAGKLSPAWNSDWIDRRGPRQARRLTASAPAPTRRWHPDAAPAAQSTHLEKDSQFRIRTPASAMALHELSGTLRLFLSVSDPEPFSPLIVTDIHRTIRDAGSCWTLQPEDPTAFAFQAGAVSDNSDRHFGGLPNWPQLSICAGLGRPCVCKSGIKRGGWRRVLLSFGERDVTGRGYAATQCPLKARFSAPYLEPASPPKNTLDLPAGGDHAGLLRSLKTVLNASPNQPLRWSIAKPRREHDHVPRRAGGTSKNRYMGRLERHPHVGKRAGYRSCSPAVVDRNQMRRAVQDMDLTCLTLDMAFICGPETDGCLYCWTH